MYCFMTNKGVSPTVDTTYEFVHMMIVFTFHKNIIPFNENECNSCSAQYGEQGMAFISIAKARGFPPRLVTILDRLSFPAADRKTGAIFHMTVFAANI